jgi:hypothetical protein
MVLKQEALPLCKCDVHMSQSARTPRQGHGDMCSALDGEFVERPNFYQKVLTDSECPRNGVLEYVFALVLHKKVFSGIYSSHTRFSQILISECSSL